MIRCIRVFFLLKGRWVCIEFKIKRVNQITQGILKKMHLSERKPPFSKQVMLRSSGVIVSLFLNYFLTKCFGGCPLMPVLFARYFISLQPSIMCIYLVISYYLISGRPDHLYLLFYFHLFSTTDTGSSWLRYPLETS